MPGSPWVAVVTDSTAYLPAETVAEHRLTVVPLQVVLGGRSLAEGVEVDSAQVARALLAGDPVTTSRPAPQTFVDTYRRLIGQGARAIVSVHLSGELSGTAEAARTAARDVAKDGIEVNVVDARSIGMGLGYPALDAARAAADGMAAAEVAAVARRRAYTTVALFYVDTLEYLRRGGRIGAAQAMLGSALAVKPLLEVHDGRLEPVDRVRTASRALARLEELVLDRAGSDPVRVTVHHLAAAQRAGELAERLGQRLPHPVTPTVSELGAVVGAHVGPGMLGVVLAPRSGAISGAG
jgi:DegV family protein with EDD domain